MSENRLYYKHQQQENTMGYAELREMIEDANHHRFEQLTWRDQPYYIHEDNTVYKLQGFYGRACREWLDSHSPLFEENSYFVYIPVATLETNGDKKTFIGYIWERANMSNYLLTMNDSTRSVYFPNLRWCDVGNHPYPKEVRCGEQWHETNFNRNADRLIHPHYDIAKAVRFPSLLGFFPNTT